MNAINGKIQKHAGVKCDRGRAADWGKFGCVLSFVSEAFVTIAGETANTTGFEHACVFIGSNPPRDILPTRNCEVAPFKSTKTSNAGYVFQTPTGHKILHEKQCDIITQPTQTCWE